MWRCEVRHAHASSDSDINNIIYDQKTKSPKPVSESQGILGVKPKAEGCEAYDFVPSQNDKGLRGHMLSLITPAPAPSPSPACMHRLI